jgi:hypothetical protein
MKKIAFALQVFTLTVILPLCVILEMNHKKAVNKQTDTVERFTGNVKAASIAYTHLQAGNIKI